MERVDSIVVDNGKDKNPVLILKTVTKNYNIDLSRLDLTIEDRQQDDLKKLMDEIGENISDIAGRLHEHLAGKRTAMLKGLRDWTDKELS